MKKFGKALSLTASAALLVSMMPLSVYAAESDKKVRVIVKNDTFSVADGAKWDGVLFDDYVTVDEDSNALTAIADAISSNGYTAVGADVGYISEVNGLNASDGGSMGGWMAAIDDWIADDALTAFSVSSGKLEDGDTISLEYTCSWGADLRYDWSANDTSLLSLAMSGGTLSSEFSGSNTEYVVTLPEDMSEISFVPKAVNRKFRTKIYKNDYTPAEKGTDYKFGEDISVNDGDTIYIGVGNAAWSSYASEEVSETVYQFSVNKETVKTDTDVESVISLINALDKTAESYQTDLKTARREYDKLTDEQKANVTNYDKLQSAEEKLGESQKASFVGTESAMGLILYSVYPDDAAAGSEWQVIIRSRFNLLSSEEQSAYAESVKEYVKTVGSAKLNKTMSTENARFVLGLTSAGIDPTNVEGYNLVEPLTDNDYVSKQGINAVAYALLALDSHGYEADSDIREKYVNALLDAQLSDNGWTFFGDTFDTDMTAMAIQALAPYCESNEKVRTAVDKALVLLSENQNDDGTFSSYGVSNAESTSQVIIALTSAGIDVFTDSRFIKNGNSLLDGLGLFVTDGDRFAHTQGGEANAVAVSQGYLALTAVYRSVNGLTSLYDMSDITFGKLPDNTSKPETSASENSGETSAISAVSSGNADKDTSKSTAAGTTASTVSTVSTVSTSGTSSHTNSDTSTVNTGANGSVFALWAAAAVVSAAAYAVLKKKSAHHS